MVSWESVSSDFKPDGALRDLYIQGTSCGDWQRLLDSLPLIATSISFSVDGQNRPIPPIEAIQDLRSKHATLLSLNISGVTFYCHFFMVEQIEMDLDPTEIIGSEQLRIIKDLMSHLGKLFGKEVVLAHENSIDLPILKYQPRQQTIVKCN